MSAAAFVALVLGVLLATATAVLDRRLGAARAEVAAPAVGGFGGLSSPSPIRVTSGRR